MERACSFVGVYDDGVKRRLDVPAEYAWIVKKDSIPRVDEIIDTHGDGGTIAVKSKVLEILKSMPKGALSRYNVKIGGSDIVVPSDQYIIREGDVQDPGPMSSGRPPSPTRKSSMRTVCRSSAGLCMTCTPPSHSRILPPTVCGMPADKIVKVLHRETVGPKTGASTPTDYRQIRSSARARRYVTSSSRTTKTFLTGTRVFIRRQLRPFRIDFVNNR
jgi:hypothetical protein